MVDNVWFNTNEPIILNFPWLKVTHKGTDYYPGLIRLRHRICHLKDTSRIAGAAEHHHGVYHFIFCMEGRNTLIVNGKENSFKAGDFFMVDPGIPHNLNPQKSDYVRFYAFTFQYLSGTQWLDWPWKRLIRYTTGFSAEDGGVTPFIDQWEKHFSLFLDKLNQPGVPDLSELGLFFFDFIRSVFLPVFGEEDLSSSYQTSPLKRTLSFIQDNYEKKLSIDDLAQVAHLSRGYLIELFKKEISVTPLAYLNDYRLDRACYLLSHTTLSNKEIADRCGYSSDSYFSKRFKISTGMTPLAYRKENRD